MARITPSPTKMISFKMAFCFRTLSDQYSGHHRRTLVSHTSALWLLTLLLFGCNVDHCNASYFDSNQSDQRLPLINHNKGLLSTSPSHTNFRSQNLSTNGQQGSNVDGNRLIDLPKINNDTRSDRLASNDLITLDDERHNYYWSIQPDDQLRTPPTTSSPGTSFLSPSSSSFVCPDQFGYFADKQDCSRYYVCVFGDPLHETCTGGLYFSSELQTCDWPQNVDCSTEIRKAQQHVHGNYNYNGQNDIVQFSNEKIELNKTIQNKHKNDDDDDGINKNNNSFNADHGGEEDGDKNWSSTEPTTSIGFDFDSNNDLDNPDFDESIASFVDTNGDVYVHDNPNGLYSLMESSNAISDHGKHVFQQQQKTPAKHNSFGQSQPQKKHVRPIKMNRNHNDENEYGTRKPQNISGDCGGRPSNNIRCAPKIMNVDQDAATNHHYKNVRFDDDETLNEDDGDGDDIDNNEDKIEDFNNDDDDDDENDFVDLENDSRLLSQSGQEEQPEQHPYPEHLLPRLNIVKKQLKDFDDGESSQPDDDGDKRQDYQNSNHINNQQVEQHQKKSIAKRPETITFVADTNSDEYLNKRDLWNYESNHNAKSSSQRSSSRLATLFDSFHIANNNHHHRNNNANNGFQLENPMSRYQNKIKTFNNHDRYLLRQQSPPGLIRPLFQQGNVASVPVFQGFQPSNKDHNNNTFPLAIDNHRRYMLQSLSMPIYSSAENKKTAERTTLWNEKFTASETPLAQSRKTEVDQNAQVIFYSYRDPVGSKFSDKINRQPAVNSVSNNSWPLLVDVSTGNDPKTPTTLEVFTIRSEDFLPKNNLTSSQTSQISEKRLKHPRNVTSNKLSTKTTTLSNIFSSDNKTSTMLVSSLVNASPTNFIKSVLPTEKPMIETSIGNNYPINRNYSLVKESINYVIQSNDPQQQCDPKLNCRLPKCFCPDVKPPNGYKRKETPQMILLTFDDAVNDVNFPLYQEIFDLNLKPSRTNPNGCPIKATFFVSHEWTDYGKVQTLYSRGHEIASHSITHSYGEKFSSKDWFKEIAGQREILHRFGGIPKNEIRGMRAPFLQVGGDEQFQMLMDANMTYDSSISIFDNAPPYWPYTLDFGIRHDCMITPCPTRSYPGLWEIGLVMWHDLVGGGRCTMGNSCTSPSDEKGVFELIMTNFKRHYETNRAPFGLFYQSNWFTTAHHKAGFLRFIDEVLKLGDVYFVTNWQLLNWIQNPVNLDRIDQFEPWQCRKDYKTQSECLMPNICHVRFKKGEKIGSRFFKTCQTCPNDYPWIDNIDQLMATN